MAVTVTFKHEGEDRGVAFGRIVVTDEEAAAADETVRRTVSASGATVASWPYGYRPDWMTETWGSYRDALAVAAEHETEVTEA